MVTTPTILIIIAALATLLFMPVNPKRDPYRMPGYRVDIPNSAFANWLFAEHLRKWMQDCVEKCLLLPDYEERGGTYGANQAIMDGHRARGWKRILDAPHEPLDTVDPDEIDAAWDEMEAEARKP